MFKITAEQDVGGEGFVFNVELAETFATAGDGYWSDVAESVRVTDMGMFVSTAEDEDERYDGDFYVLYNTEDWVDEDNGLIYTDSLFLEHLQTTLAKALVQMGVETATATELAGTVNYSEQGMQDEGRVSCDAYELGDFLRKHYAKQTA